jgi:hypothetical protein
MHDDASRTLLVVASLRYDRLAVPTKMAGLLGWSFEVRLPACLRDEWFLLLAESRPTTLSS